MIHRVVIIYFLLIAVLNIAYSESLGEGGYDILLVVGDVNVNNARILYEDVTNREPVTHKREIMASLYHYNTKEFVEEKKLELKNFPQVVQFSNLKENQKYYVQFGERNAYNNYVTFTTFKKEHDTQKMPFIFLSCNRFVEDQTDSFMWEKLYTKHFQSTVEQDQRYFQNFDNNTNNYVISNDNEGIKAIFHNGDQIYGDQIYDEIKRELTNKKCLTYFDILNKFREYYKITWKNNPYTRLVLTTPRM